MIPGLVSIITPAYNCTKFLPETVKSAQAQTYTNWEMLIVDDCSTDDTVEMIKKLSAEDSRIRLLQLPENSGTAMARNLGMANAQGEYIAFLDSDDLWHPDKLQKQIEFMTANDYPFCCTHYQHIFEDGQPTGKVVYCQPKANYNRVLLDNPVGNSTVIFNRGKLGDFEVPNIRKRNDYALWLKMLRSTPYIYGIDEVLASYRINSNSISRNKLSLVKYQWHLYRKIEHINVFRAAFHVCWWGVIKIFHLK
jgi:teichuronic acid biosynthesis glycosyltransferase TuaG